MKGNKKAISKKAYSNLIEAGTFKERIEALLENFDRVDTGLPAYLSKKQEVSILEAIYKEGNEAQSNSAYKWVKAHEITALYTGKVLNTKALVLNNTLWEEALICASYYASLKVGDTPIKEQPIILEKGVKIEVRAYQIKAVIIATNEYLASIGMEAYPFGSLSVIENQISTALKSLSFLLSVFGTAVGDITYFNKYEDIDIRPESKKEIIEALEKYAKY